MDLYAENILDHYKHPRHAGEMRDATVSHHEENLSCGDDLTIALKISDGKIEDIQWKGQGCAISQSGMSILSEELIGKSLSDAITIKPEHVKELLGVPIGPRRFKCALLCLHTLKNALRKYEKQEPQTWIETVEVDE